MIYNNIFISISIYILSFALNLSQALTHTAHIYKYYKHCSSDGKGSCQLGAMEYHKVMSILAPCRPAPWKVFPNVTSAPAG